MSLFIYRSLLESIPSQTKTFVLVSARIPISFCHAFACARQSFPFENPIRKYKLFRIKSSTMIWN